MRLADEFVDMLKSEVYPVKLDIHDDERGITIYGRFDSSAVRREINRWDCIKMSEDALLNTVLYVVRDIYYELTHCK
jgi:hypothetical protein